MAVNPIPDGYHSLTPYLIVDGAAEALEYYKKAFGAIELMRIEHGGKIAHSDMKIGNSPFMVSDEHPEQGFRGPKSLGGSSIGLMIYVDDVDTIFKQAVDAGGVEKTAVKDQFYGDRSGTLTDLFGHVWTVATHTEDVSPEEMDKRMAAMAAGGQG